MSFHPVRLPKFLEGFLQCQPSFNTNIITSSSGFEIRVSGCSQCKNMYAFNNCFLSQEEFDIFNSFFRARLGSRFAFLLKDYADFTVRKQNIARGDGVNTRFQLYKLYHDRHQPYSRKITRVKAADLVIYFDDEQINNGWHLAQNSGLVTFEMPPANGINITASFDFLITVRFKEDNFDYVFKDDGTVEVKNVHLIEVLE
jgi:uncharacterized protein (TIGR02217 family)